MCETRMRAIVFASRLNGETGMYQLRTFNALMNDAQSIWQGDKLVLFRTHCHTKIPSVWRIFVVFHVNQQYFRACTEYQRQKTHLCCDYYTP